MMSKTPPQVDPSGQQTCFVDFGDPQVRQSSSARFAAAKVQGDHSVCFKPLIDIQDKSSVLICGAFTKTQHLLLCQREVLNNMHGHPVEKDRYRNYQINVNQIQSFT